MFEFYKNAIARGRGLKVIYALRRAGACNSIDEDEYRELLVLASERLMRTG